MAENIDEIIKKFTIDTPITKCNLIEKLVGCGSYGKIYSLKDIPNIVVKYGCNPESDIKKEYDIYTEINKYYDNPTWIPKIYGYKEEGNHNCMFMERLSSNISDATHYIIHDDDREEMIYHYAKEIINIFEKLHEMGYIYMDTKYDNFLTTIDDRNTIKVIDLGFMVKWKNSDGDHFGKYVLEPKRYGDSTKYIDFYGCYEFSSFHDTEDKRPSRRDDMISIGYLIIYLLNNNELPWNSDMPQKKRYKRKILRRYLDCDILPNEVKKYMEYVESLKYSQKPDYDYCIHLLES